MEVIDIIILAAFIPGIIKGIKSGFIGQIAGIGGLFLGFYLSYKFSALLSTYLAKWIPSFNEPTIKAISFALIIIVVVVAVYFLGKAVEKVFTVTMLGWLNKLLGVVFAIAASALIIGLLLTLISYVNNTWFTVISQDKISNSLFYTPLSDLANTVFPYLKAFFKF